MEKTYCSKGRLYNCSAVTTFKDLMDNIVWDWSSEHTLVKLIDGEFQINKTTIGEDFVDYKCEYSPLAEGLFLKLEKFYELLQEEEEK